MDDDTEHAAPPETETGVGTITAVLGLLVLLTALTVGVALIDLSPAAHVTAAMVIAATKSVLVALFFMHLGHESRLVLIMALGSILLLATLVGFVFIDTFNRGF